MAGREKAQSTMSAPIWHRSAVWGGVAAAGLGLGAMAAAAGGTALAWPMVGVGLAGLLGLAWNLGRNGTGGTAEMLLAAAEASHDARLLTDGEEKFIYANPAFHQLFAMPVSLDAIGDIVETGGEDLDTFARLRSSARTGSHDLAVVSLRTGPHEPIEWRKISVTPIPDRAGMTLWRAEDVTAEKEIEIVRRTEDERLADFIDHMPAGFFSADAEGRILFINATLAGWLGLPSGSLMRDRAHFADFVVAAGRETRSENDDEGETNGDVVLRAADGATFRACLLQSVHSGKGGAIHTRSLVLKDMTWRRKDEPSSSASAIARKLHWLFDEAPVGIVLLGLDGTVSECNRAFLKMIGLHRDAVVGRAFTDRLNKEDRSEASAQISKVVMGAARAATLDVRMPGSGGRELVSSLYASRLEDDEGEVAGLVLHFIDTTEQRDLEVQFAQSQKMHAVGQLAGGIAHDFNNLLTAMIGFCDLLLERNRPGDPDFSDIIQIKQNANRATNLVRQMLAFSRKQTLKPVVLDVTASLSELSNLLGRLIGEVIDLEFIHGYDLYPVKADPGQFDQVVINLAVNARDAMPGGGALTIKTSNITLDAPVERGTEHMPAGDYVLIEVMDTGVGIPKENLVRIFDPFFTTKGPGAGTGLGLSTVYGIVRQSEGFVFVDSAPGEGTTFSVYLPRWRMEEGAHTETAPETLNVVALSDHREQAADLTGAGTILLVEDEDGVRMFAARALRNKGYQVLEASDGEHALDVVNQSGLVPDLIISDVVMPGMDGHTLIQLARQEFPDVKVILMSGYAEDALSENIQADTSVHFMGKPFSLKDLAGTVKKVMSAG